MVPVQVVAPLLEPRKTLTMSGELSSITITSYLSTSSKGIGRTFGEEKCGASLALEIKLGYFSNLTLTRTSSQLSAPSLYEIFYEQGDR